MYAEKGLSYKLNQEVEGKLKPKNLTLVDLVQIFACCLILLNQITSMSQRRLSCLKESASQLLSCSVPGRLKTSAFVTGC